MIWRKERPQRLTGVSATLKADHRNAAGEVHGHTWEIRVWCCYNSDALLLRHALDRLLEQHQGKCLPDAIAWAESLAAWVAGELASDGYLPVEVEISRAAERLHAKWIAAQPHRRVDHDR